uniref:histidine--tRNA ligase n=1 Tax=Cafeteria roenbergensis TaxID=33653 RepID=A0A7S0PF09_CAFRO|mmetsp:Transcript_24254/g.91526  ORF Transcript_24254/g.91526 Transcript_24254/m.91526 type:complete len:161 (+) Transcript_24254:30-512(+)
MQWTRAAAGATPARLVAQGGALARAIALDAATWRAQALASASPTRRAGHSGNTVLGSSQRRWASGQSSRPVKGMRDLHGEDMASLAAVRAAFWDTVGLYGFEEWQTPILESSGVFTGSLGADSDVVAKEMFRFSTLGGEDVCMRPEGTAGETQAAASQSP